MMHSRTGKISLAPEANMDSCPGSIRNCSENRVDAASRRVACPAKPLHAARRRVYGVREGFCMRHPVRHGA
jgi:hypothetical protein